MPPVRIHTETLVGGLLAILLLGTVILYAHVSTRLTTAAHLKTQLKHSAELAAAFIAVGVNEQATDEQVGAVATGVFKKINPSSLANIPASFTPTILLFNAQTSFNIDTSPHHVYYNSHSKLHENGKPVKGFCRLDDGMAYIAPINNSSWAICVSFHDPTGKFLFY